MVEWPVTQESSVVLYPNPSQGSFKIELPDFTHNTCIRIFETNGKEIYQTQVQSTQNIEINDFTAPPGSYFVEILAAEREGIEPSEILYFTVVMSF
jgi:hypothetical protein